MFELIIIFFIFAAIEISAYAFSMNAIGIGCTVLTAVCTYIGTILTIRYMFKDVLKEAKESATEKAALNQRVNDSERHINATFITFGERMDKMENSVEHKYDKIDKKLDNISERLSKVEGKLEK